MKITYKSCDQVPKEDIYKIFKFGYQDYLIPIDIPEDVFFNRFFQLEGNNLETSHIAYDGDLPIGLILGGIREFDGVKTMRCGGFCLLPAYRGIGLGQKLFALHEESAKEENCKQLFLEVIYDNQGALTFYQKSGYKPLFNLNYLEKNNTDIKTIESDMLIHKSSWMEVNIFFYNHHTDIHIPWQNTLDSLEHNKDYKFFLATDSFRKSIGYLIINNEGNIKQIWVEPEHRLKGIGSTLVSYAIETLSLEALSISFSNSASLHGFTRSLHFTPKTLSQIEMFKIIG